MPPINPMRRVSPMLRLLLLVAALAVLGTITAEPVSAQAKKTQRAAKQPDSPKPANIDKNGVVILVKSAILALDQANKTGNYTVLRDLGSPDFQVNSAARLAEIFASHRARGLDLGGILVLEPQLSLLPQIEPNGVLRMAGFFPSVPTQVNFELLFQPVNRQWRIFGISVNLSSGAPKAPDMPLPPPPQASAEPPLVPSEKIDAGPEPEPVPAPKN